MSNPKISVGNNYKLIKKIGKGSFGEVYLATDRNGEEYACKIESNSSKNRLKGESLIYKRFAIKELDCVPTVYKYIETPEYNLLIMQLLGKSLDSIFEECGGKLDVGTVMKLGVTIINHLEKIHRIGIIHRDIKPNNFMFGINDHSNDLYVMDFGLSKKWYVDGTHIEFKVGRSMIGTARYASLNIHNGTEPSRRDDMESVGYMLVYLVKGSLPWQGLKKKTKENPMDKIGDKKMMVDLKALCEDLPDCFYEYINYTRNLQFTEKPDYDYLRELFISSAESNNIKMKYFWEDDGGQSASGDGKSNKVGGDTSNGAPQHNTSNVNNAKKQNKQQVVRKAKKDADSNDDEDNEEQVKRPVQKSKTLSTKPSAKQNSKQESKQDTKQDASKKTNTNVVVKRSTNDKSVLAQQKTVVAKKSKEDASSNRANSNSSVRSDHESTSVSNVNSNVKSNANSNTKSNAKSSTKAKPVVKSTVKSKVAAKTNTKTNSESNESHKSDTKSNDESQSDDLSDSDIREIKRKVNKPVKHDTPQKAKSRKRQGPKTRSGDD